MAWRIGVDVGGTFTDLAAWTTRRRGASREGPSTPADQSIGVAAGLEALFARHGVPPAAVTYLGHGTTVCINAVLRAKRCTHRPREPRRGCATCSSCGRQIRDDLYDLQADKPRRSSCETSRREVRSGRWRAGTWPRRSISMRSAPARRVSVRAGCRGAASASLHSYVNPAHERAVAELVRASSRISICPSRRTCCGSFREFERLSTTVMNAYVGPGGCAAISEALRGASASPRSGPPVRACSSSESETLTVATVAQGA